MTRAQIKALATEMFKDCFVYLTVQDELGNRCYLHRKPLTAKVEWNIDGRGSIYGYAIVRPRTKAIVWTEDFGGGPFNVKVGDTIYVDVGKVWFGDEKYKITLKEIIRDMASEKNHSWLTFGF